MPFTLENLQMLESNFHMLISVLPFEAMLHFYLAVFQKCLGSS